MVKCFLNNSVIKINLYVCLAANYYNYYTGVSRDVAESRGIKTLEISVLDADEHKDVIYAQFDKVADFISNNFFLIIITKKFNIQTDEHISQGNNVLVHCAAGVSRSSTLTLSYLIKHHKLPLSKAYDILVSSRKVKFSLFSFFGNNNKIKRLHVPTMDFGWLYPNGKKSNWVTYQILLLARYQRQPTGTFNKLK